MNFSNFLQKIYESKKHSVRRQNNFVIDLFKSTGANFYYEDDYAKKIFNGRKPLSNEVRNSVPTDLDIKCVINYLKDCINENRLQDLLDAFDIEKDEKKDFNMLIEALAIQFENYIKYGEKEINTTVKSIYEILIDQAGNGSIPNANEIALFSAKQCFYSAVKNLTNINVNNDIANLKGPFENYFIGIQNTIKTFEAKCNRDGRCLFKKIRDDVLNKEVDGLTDKKLDINYFLAIITEPGSLPIDLVKQIHFTIYDNQTFEDKTTEVSIRLFDDYESNKKLEALESIEFYKVNEIPFTERITFNIEGSKRNLLDDAHYILIRISIILNALEDSLEKFEKMQKINERLINLYTELQFRDIQFITDGTYYPNTKKVEYAITIEPFFFTKDGIRIQPGDILLDSSTLFFFKSYENFETNFESFFSYYVHMLQKMKFEEMMVEIISFNDDGKCRYYMFPPTSKAKNYRMIRLIADRILNDGTIGFMAAMLMFSNKYSNELVKKTSHERQTLGKEILVGYGYCDNKHYSVSADVEEIKRGNIKVSRFLSSHIFTPIIKNIKLYEAFKEELKNSSSENEDK